jgi:DNA-binding HxlR family transcriptional regulator
MMMPKRSNCPIANALDFVGDKWSLLILRDLIFFKKQSYSDLKDSDEGMATNILSSRLEKLESDGLILKTTDPLDKRKKIYSITEAGLDMLPILLEMLVWSSKHASSTHIPDGLVERIKTDRNTLIKELVANH